MEEDSYRQSRLCRLLGNPVAFAVVELLANNNELNPSEISRAVGRSVQRVSTVLGALRLAEVVRYDSDGKRNRYRTSTTLWFSSLAKTQRQKESRTLNTELKTRRSLMKQAMTLSTRISVIRLKP